MLDGTPTTSQQVRLLMAAAVLAGRAGIRPTTRLSHTGYIEQFLIPHIGHLRLREVTPTRLPEMFTRIAGQTNRVGRPHTPSTLAHVRTTLRAAINAAVRDGLIGDNPARHIELPANPRPRPVVWTRRGSLRGGPPAPDPGSRCGAPQRSQSPGRTRRRPITLR